MSFEDALRIALGGLAWVGFVAVVARFLGGAKGPLCPICGAARDVHGDPMYLTCERYGG